MVCSGPSCEFRRTSTYREDLKWRMVWQRECLSKKCSKVAINLNVDAATVSRIVARFRQTGEVQKKSYPSDRAFRKFTLCLEFMIIHLTLMHPGILLCEIQVELLEITRTDISLSTICRFLHKNGFTRQKLRLAAIQQNNLLQSQFVSDVSIFNQETLIFMDETGSDRRNCIRQYGYSLRGKLLVSRKLLVRGERISAIAMMSVNGILDYKTVNQSHWRCLHINYWTVKPQLTVILLRRPPTVIQSPYKVPNNCPIHGIH